MCRKKSIFLCFQYSAFAKPIVPKAKPSTRKKVKEPSGDLSDFLGAHVIVHSIPDGIGKIEKLRSK